MFFNGEQKIMPLSKPEIDFCQVFFCSHYVKIIIHEESLDRI